MLNAERDVHLAKEAEAGITDHRNGTSDKTLLTAVGELELSIPRDRYDRVDPALIRKYCRRFPGLDDKILALYARGMSTEISSAACGRSTASILDGLKGFPEAITAVFPDALVQTCIVHLIRYSIHASWKERNSISGAFCPIHRTENAEAAAAALDAFDRDLWGRKYPAIAQSWRRNWEGVIPFFAFAAEVRKIS